MTTFDSPIGRCEAARAMVLLDQTQLECACEHGCPPDRICPLDHCFAEESGLSNETLAELASRQLLQMCLLSARLSVPPPGPAELLGHN